MECDLARPKSCADLGSLTIGTPCRMRSLLRSIAGCPAYASIPRSRSSEIIGSQRAAPARSTGTGAPPGAIGSSQQWSVAMALPTTGAAAPEHLPLPDVRRLDQMPSWPAWVASRIESMKDACQPSGADRRYRTVPTLPSNSTLSPAERIEIERHVADLRSLCEQTPQADASWEATTLVVVTKLMLALPSAQQNEVGAEASGEAFMAALEDIPTWAVAAAAHRWYRGDCGKNEHGQPYDYRWRPAPADLRRIALTEKFRIYGRVATLRRLLAAEPEVFSEEHCSRMRARLASLLKVG